MPNRNLIKIENRRLQGFRLLKKGMSQSDVARELGVTRQTVHVWKKELEQNPKGWKAKPLGRPPIVSDEKLRKAAKVLRMGLGAYGYRHRKWDAPLICEIIFDYGHHRYDCYHVTRLANGMGFTCKKPKETDSWAYKKWQDNKWYSLDHKSKKPTKRS